jgi:4-aminobutyrate aminotransferase
MENAAKVGQYAINWLNEVMDEHPSLGQIRGKGLMIGVDFVKDRETHAPDKKLRDRVVERAFEYGLIMLGCGQSTIRIAPPLNITQTEMEEALIVFDHVISEIEQEEKAVHLEIR